MLLKMRFEKKLMIGSFIIIFSIIFPLSTYFYRYISNVLIDIDLKNSKQLVQKISNQIDMLYRQIDNGAANLVYNKEVIEIMVQLNSNSQLSSYDTYYYDMKLKEYTGVIFYSVPMASKVIIFNSMKNFFFIYGNINNNEMKSSGMEYDRIKWYENLIEKGKLLSIAPPHFDDWSSSPNPVISVYRRFVNNYFNDFGILEIQVPYKKFQEICEINSSTNENSILVFNEEGKLVFPLEPSDELLDRYQPSRIINAIKESKNGCGEINLPKGPILFSSYKSDYSCLTVAMASNQKLLLSQIIFYRNIIILSGFLILTIILVAFFLLVRKLTKPLKQLISTVKNVNLEKLALEVPTGGYDEFRMLNDSFNSMFSKLKESINKVYESKIREMQAHFTALQSQINPHFIFNTLNVISAQSEEQNSRVIVEMCNRLSEMMRYAVTPFNTVVSLSDEITHALNYLELIKMHYDDCLSYEIDIPHDMYNMTIPKLIIQPIVENSISHGFEKIRPPWHILIKGEIKENDKWELIIKDNGSGFPQELLDKIAMQISEYRANIFEGNLIENLKIGGMGILNTYARLAIHYGEFFTCAIENVEPRGCIVKLAGPVKWKEDKSIND